MRILHLSDIQEGKFGIKPDLQDSFSENWEEKYKDILMDIKNEFYNIHLKSPIDIIAITGDLASTGSKEEYDNLSKEFVPIIEEIFLKGLKPIPKNRWIILPGNHDVQWYKNEKRFNNFVNFCKENGFESKFIINKTFSIFDSTIFYDKLTNKKIELLLFNSCLNIFNKISRKNVNISKNYFNKINDYFSKDENLPKIMLCHHRLHEISYNHDHALDELRRRNVVLALVGDIHHPDSMADEICKIKCISAGSLFAKKTERKVGIDYIPRQFNVYNIDLETGILYPITYIKSVKWDRIKREPIELPFGIKKKSFERKKLKTLKEREFHALFLLKWSNNWKGKWNKKIGFSNYENFYNFLIESKRWLPVLIKLEKIVKGSKWLQNAFSSIRMGTKGLFQSRYLDYALISVPPPVPLFNKIIGTLEEHFAIGIAAPSGWGKSRLVLWVALAFALKNKKVYYFPDPFTLIDDQDYEIIIELLHNSNILVIMDDYHLKRDNFFWNKAILIARNNHSSIILLQTLTSETEKSRPWPREIHIITVNEYRSYWETEWVDRFTKWFKGLSNTTLKKFIYIDNLSLAQKSESPWSFVSVIVNLQNLIKKQLSIEQTPDLVILLTLFSWGYAVSGEKGLSPEDLYSGLLWLYRKKRLKWDRLKETGGKLWNFVEEGKKEEFIYFLVEIISLWRKSPKDSSEILLLPSEGRASGPNVPVSVHHIAWWGNTLKKLWKTDWKKWSILEEICEMIIVHSSPRIIGKWISIKDSCEILKDCNKLRSLSLEGIPVKNVRTLKTCKNLQVLNLNWTKVSDISSLYPCKNLQELYLNRTKISMFRVLSSFKDLQKLSLNRTKIINLNVLKHLNNLQVLRLEDTDVEDFKILEDCKSLQTLDLGWTNVSDISSLESCKNLQELYLNNTGVSNINALKFCAKLQILDLSGTRVFDIRVLENCPNLQVLRLAGTNVRIMNVLEILKVCKNLEILDIRNTDITDANLLRSFPNVKIYLDIKNVFKDKTQVLIIRPGPSRDERGVKVVIEALKDASMEAIYSNQIQTPIQIIDTAIQRHVDVIGILIASESQIDIIPKIMKIYREKKLKDVLVVAGGLIPEENIRAIKMEGIVEVFGTNTPPSKFIEFISKKITEKKKKII